tara:strand:+ start:2332 stop:4014 length:1683 start_codon:yes stop_codon:yes gene_type:complete
MTKTIIYSCVFFNEKYINLANLLLKSYKLFGNSSDDVDYLIICNPELKDKIQDIFDSLHINGKIWCIKLKSIFEVGYSKLQIFNYPYINSYNKILYLNYNVLITNSIHNILDLPLDNKLYAPQEGNTNNDLWGKQFFDNNPNCSAFTSDILLFNNNTIINKLFSQILLHINSHIKNNSSMSHLLDQPFIVYHAIKDNVYDNKQLTNIVINNPNHYNNETICHFTGGPGEYESKIIKMTNYMKNIMFNTRVYNNNNINNHCVSINTNLNDEKAKFLISSCNILNNKLKIIGKNTIIKKGFKIDIFIKYLQGLDNEIILLNDAYDVFYLDNIDIIITKFKKFNKNIVISGEKWYSHQEQDNKMFFDKMSEDIYKYINSGLIIGYSKDLLILYEDAKKILQNPDYQVQNLGDQYCLSMAIKNNFNKYNLTIDYKGKLFYNAVKDWDNINKYIDSEFKLLETSEYPSVIHVPYISKYLNVLKKLFFTKYNYLSNKIFIWENSTIIFLENGKMKAFGLGEYYFIDKYLVKCDFGNREHLLKFNKDYSQFISVRKDDFEVVVGNHL